MNRLLRRAFIAGAVSTLPWIVAAVGWTAHWNAYVNLLLTIVGAVLVWSGVATTLGRYQRRGE